MNLSTSKVAIVGCGFVGASAAFSLVTQGICDEVLMIDINEEKALGEVKDLRNAIRYLNRNVRVNVGHYEECKDVDIIILTAAVPGGPGKSRLDMAEGSAKICKSIVAPIMASGFDGIFLVVSNPVDIMAHFVYKLSGLPKNQVIGTGTSLDSARLSNFIADLVHMDPRNVHAYCMGEHGDSQMVPWSTVTVAGKSFSDLIHDNRELVGDVDLDELVRKTATEGWEIVTRKGTTYYGIASACAGIVKAILQDENKIIPVSALLEGEYGEYDVFAGVPVVLNRTGASDIGELRLTPEEMEKFKASVAIIREYSEEIEKKLL